jgi:hypothetical protein
MNSNGDLSEFDLSDSSSSNDSDIKDLLHNLEDNNEATLLLLTIKELEDYAWLLGRRRGSVMGRVSIERNRALSHAMLIEDYFAKVPTYPAHLFRRRFHMQHSLFVQIIEACEANLNYFKQHRNATGQMGFSAYQKISATMRVLSYGVPADYTNEYL